MFEAVSYHLPKSQSFHQATKGAPRQALQRIEQMMADMADDPQVKTPMRLRVEGTSAPDGAIATACLDEARKLFGAEDYPGEAIHTWDLAPQHRDAAIRFALSDERWPRQQSGPIGLAVAYHFNWRDFPGALPAPLSSWQHGTCMLLLDFDRRTLRVAPSFVFPVAYDSGAFQEFITRLRAAVPFEINDKHLRRMLVNPKTGGIRELRLGASAGSSDRA